MVDLANDTTHGLAAGVFTRDGARQMRMARAIRAGIVWINTYRVVSPIAEFGGVKGSGYGRESGFQAMYDYTRPKTVWVNTSSDPDGEPLRDALTCDKAYTAANFRHIQARFWPTGPLTGDGT